MREEAGEGEGEGAEEVGGKCTRSPGASDSDVAPLLPSSRKTSEIQVRRLQKEEELR